MGDQLGHTGTGGKDEGAVANSTEIGTKRLRKERELNDGVKRTKRNVHEKKSV